MGCGGGELDKHLKSLVMSEPLLKGSKQLTFDERVERMYTKIQTNAVRHKSNFKGIEYDLDRQVVEFISNRKAQH